MEDFIMEKNIRVICKKATIFPEGVLQAHQALQSILSNSEKRKFFGISYPGKDGSIIYRAAAEEIFEGEAENLASEIFIIKKGKYISQFIPDFRNDTSAIGNTFRALLAYPGIDPNGYCLEIYTNPKDVICMIPLHKV
jgi:hypothetical protein